MISSGSARNVASSSVVIRPPRATTPPPTTGVSPPRPVSLNATCRAAPVERRIGDRRKVDQAKIGFEPRRDRPIAPNPNALRTAAGRRPLQALAQPAGEAELPPILRQGKDFAKTGLVGGGRSQVRTRLRFSVLQGENRQSRRKLSAERFAPMQAIAAACLFSPKRTLPRLRSKPAASAGSALAFTRGT